MRRFTTFADPPQTLAGGGMLGSAVASAPVAAAALAGSRPLFSAPGSASPGLFVGASRSEVTARAPAQARPKPRPGPVRRQAPQPRSPAAPAVAAAAVAGTGAAAALAVPRDPQVARLLLDVGGGPQLRMDLEEPLMRAPASAMAMASDAAAIIGGEGSAEPDRLAALERTLAQLRRDGQATQQANSGMQARLADAEARSRLMPWLLGLLLFSLLLAAWLALRVRKQARELDAAPKQWWASSGMAPADLDSTGPVPVPVPSIAGELIDEPAPSPAAVAAAWPAEATVEPDVHERTAAFTGPYGTDSTSPASLEAVAHGPTREVSVEELLDLEQQADFFIALGQEDAAVDLLMAHLRSTGGLSPLPYTKLLEIYKRQGDRGAYERIRARFNRRFNAYAPHWDIGPLQGRALEEYPEVVSHLQALWSSPLDAMAVLEAMLFRKDETQELFDLPAYKDVLLLYSLARDLWQSGGGTSADAVDVLLPLGDAAGNDSGRMPLAAGASRATLDEPLVPQEYDLTAFELEPRISTRATLNPAPDDADGEPRKRS